MASQQPNLLTIPYEIRVQILRYILLTDNHDDDIPNAITVSWPCFYKSEHPGFCATAELSKLFMICRQLHDEFEELLYTRFVFVFSSCLNGIIARELCAGLSVRAKGLLREIMLPLHVVIADKHTDEELAEARPAGAEKGPVTDFTLLAPER